MILCATIVLKCNVNNTELLPICTTKIIIEKLHGYLWTNVKLFPTCYMDYLIMAWMCFQLVNTWNLFIWCHLLQAHEGTNSKISAIYLETLGMLHIGID
jgi:hypothetical protein